MTFHFYKIWKNNHNGCVAPAFLYIGFRGIESVDDKLIQGVGACFCKKHAPLVLQIIKSINVVKRHHTPAEIEIIPLFKPL